MSLSAGTLMTLLFLGLTTFTILDYLQNRKRLPLPPGPPRWLVLGNLLQIPTHKQWEVYHGWATEYSKLIATSALALRVLWY